MKVSIPTPRYKPPIAAIRPGLAGRQPNEARYGRLLLWYMRLLAALWIAQGIGRWVGILVADGSGPGTLDTMTTLGAGAVIFFCLVDPIAAVGLWLAAPWGGVVWLVAVSAQWIDIALLPRFFDHDILVGLADFVLVAGYFALTYMAARENAPYS